MMSSLARPCAWLLETRLPKSAAYQQATLSGWCGVGDDGRKRIDGLNIQRWMCHAVSKAGIHPDWSLIRNGLPITEFVEEVPSPQVSKLDEVDGMINGVKQILRSMGDGEISISAYDTAWVALVRAADGSGKPQFPSSLGWIADNQLPDGSWGDKFIFLAHDRMLSTLACAIALKSWSIFPDKCERGLRFIRENMWRLADEDEMHMLIGFEVAFPSLVEIAKGLGLELPYDHAALQDIYVMRKLKLSKIPKDVLHKIPTTLLHTLEGMPGLDWEKLLQLRCSNGSFLFSPSSTAYALMQTGDEQCLHYLQRAIERFNGGVPNVYPVDLFEHIWAVDRLQRLGISRYFQDEIEDCMDYVFRYWTEEGICWARNTIVHDVDDTAMGFRLLRLHGYDVSPNVFRQFEKDGEFFCFAGQSNQAVTGIYNLNRASQVLFPGEEILERVKNFSYNFLKEKQASNQLLDKWMMSKDLPGEVEYALDFPWYASLPRVEARLYIEQYGGSKDVWIGKSLYRMPYVSSDVYLELAKADFNHCQAFHQRELLALQRWREEWGLGEHGVSRGCLLRSYFLAASTFFEPERAAERLGWARTAAIAEAIAHHLRADETRQAFIYDFLDASHGSSKSGRISNGWPRTERKRIGRGSLAAALHKLLDFLETDALRHGWLHYQQIRQQLQQAWEEWMVTWRNEGWTAMLLVRTIEVCGGRSIAEEPPTAAVAEEYDRLAKLTSSICNDLFSLSSTQENGEVESSATSQKAVDLKMQELVHSVLQRSSELSNETKQTFLTVAKSFYYVAHCSPAALNMHIAKVLFEPVA